MTLNRLPTVLALLLALAITACGDSGPTPEEMITGSWKLRKMEIKNEMAPPQIMATASFNFSKDGSYEILLGELDRGTWKLSEDDKVLITTPAGAAVDNHIDIEKITEDELILYNKQGPNPVRMVLMPDE